MSITEADWRNEQARLAEAMREIERQLAKTGGVSQERRDEIIGMRKYMWEELRMDNANLGAALEAGIDIVQNSLELIRMDKAMESAVFRRRKLQKLSDSAYFGRIDFKEQGSQASEPIYIGTASLFEENTDEHLVFDWRSPIAGMYYDYGPGTARYETPEGPIEGDIVLKRQYHIRGETIHYMFDTGLNIGDEMLQRMLGGHAEDRMKSIVTTIQAEQNRIIRDESHPVMIVQGAAGSGKTSVALQRVAYLLYKHRKWLKPEQMLLFSPNPIFSDYVSRVLPELGEEPVNQTTFQDYLDYRLDRYAKVEDRYDQLENSLNGFDAFEANERDAIRAGLAFKSSEAFVRVVDRYASLLLREGLIFDPIVYGGDKEKVWRSEQQLAELYYGEFGHTSPEGRLERMQDRLLAELEELEKRQVKKAFRNMRRHPNYLGANSELREMAKRLVGKKVQEMRRFIKTHSFVNSLRTYVRLFEDAERFAEAFSGIDLPADWDTIRRTTIERLGRGTIPYEDASPLLYLEEAIRDRGGYFSIRYLLIDEAQDYNPFQYAIIRRMFPRSRMTLLGDLNQTIQPDLQLEGYEQVAGLLRGGDDAGVVRLTKCYRSTKEIVEFTRAMLPDGEAIEAVSRSGPKPAVIAAEAGASHTAAVSQSVRELAEAGNRSIAIVCRSGRESAAAYEALRELLPELRLITKDDMTFHSGLLVLPVYLAKGLEFDAVVVYDASRAAYDRDEDRHLLYTACTRALHRLQLVAPGEVSPLITGVDASLYETQQPVR